MSSNNLLLFCCYTLRQGSAARVPLFHFPLYFPSCSLTPFIYMSFFNVLLHLNFCLPLDLLPVTLSSHALLTNDASSLLTTCPNHLSLQYLLSVFLILLSLLNNSLSLHLYICPEGGPRASTLTFPSTSFQETFLLFSLKPTSLSP